MRTCLYYICRDPTVYACLQSEIDDFYETNNLTDPITYMQTQQLSYLQAVIKEATRLIPSIVYQLLRYTLAGGLIVDGEIRPVLPIHDQTIWGLDANEFRTERCLEDEARTRYLEGASMTFGGNAPRICIGRNIALVSFSFEWVLASGQQKWVCTCDRMRLS